MERKVAEALAKQVGALLAPACAEVAIVGSIRRSKPEVKDIELLCRPFEPRPVFGEKLSAVNPLEALVARLLKTGQLKKHPDPSKRKDGPKYKTLWLPESNGITLDLFIADPSGENWGNLMAIRTGDYEFSQLLVTPRKSGGLLPNGFMECAGYLWDFRLPREQREGFTREKATQLGKRPIACRTEAEFFLALGLGVGPDPFNRNKTTAERLRRSVGYEATAAGVGRR